MATSRPPGFSSVKACCTCRASWRRFEGGVHDDAIVRPAVVEGVTADDGVPFIFEDLAQPPHRFDDADLPAFRAGQVSQVTFSGAGFSE